MILLARAALNQLAWIIAQGCESYWWRVHRIEDRWPSLKGYTLARVKLIQRERCSVI